MSPSETDATEFYLIEYMLQDLEEKITEENKRYKKQEEDSKKQQSSYKAPAAPKVGNTNYGGFKTPKLAMPKISMPKL
jgi:hypothetical protein